MSPSVTMLSSRQEAPKKNTDCSKATRQPYTAACTSQGCCSVPVCQLVISASDWKLCCTHRHLTSTFKLDGCRIQVSTSFPKCCSHHRGNLRAYRYPWVAIIQSITLSRGNLLRASCNWQLRVIPAVLVLGVSECFTRCHPSQALWRPHH